MAKKVALVTGGTSGIGLETAIHLKKKDIQSTRCPGGQKVRRASTTCART